MFRESGVQKRKSSLVRSDFSFQREIRSHFCLMREIRNCLDLHSSCVSNHATKCYVLTTYWQREHLIPSKSFLRECVITLHATSWPHAGLKILGVGTRDAEIQLSLQHPLPHPATFITRGAAACRPRRPGGVDTRLRCVV